jgi:hypothetical protein
MNATTTKTTDSPPKVSAAARRVKLVNHTPGPWRRTPIDELGKSFLIESVSPHAVAQVGEFFAPLGALKPKACADARLIASAPELLEALELHLKFLKSLPPGWLGKTSGDVGCLNEAYVKSERAIAKVKGGAHEIRQRPTFGGCRSARSFPDFQRAAVVRENRRLLAREVARAAGTWSSAWHSPFTKERPARRSRAKRFSATVGDVVYPGRRQGRDAASSCAASGRAAARTGASWRKRRPALWFPVRQRGERRPDQPGAAGGNFGSTANEDRPDRHLACGGVCRTSRSTKRTIRGSSRRGRRGRGYDVRCLDGGAWDRPTCWGMFATLEEALACAGKGPAWLQPKEAKAA